MRLVVVEPPAPVVTWEDADKHLRLGGDMDAKAEVEGMIAAATEFIDAPDGYLGRAIGAQVLEARFDMFDGSGLFLPCPPIIDVLSVSYLDTRGDLQTLGAETWELFGRQLLPAHRHYWPATLDRPEAVRVRYRAGYEELPAPIRSAILIMVADLYRNRGEALIGQGTATVAMETTAANLLRCFRIWA